MTRIDEILKAAAETLAKGGVDEPGRQAASLLSLALEKDRTFLIAHPEYEPGSGELALFEDILRRRAGREPLQYIRGTQEFYGLEFEVAPGVLIPRPETEILVENAISLLMEKEGPAFCEIGTGSGCIGISILRKVPGASAVGLDISGAALDLTHKNAEKHGVSDRLRLLRSDLFSALAPEKFDLIVSNPPYIPKEEYDRLEPEVRDFEPETALTDGGGGLSIIGRIAGESPAFLKPGGFLLMEIGFGQAEKVTEIFNPRAWQSFEILPDLQSIPRTVKARLK